jgi:rhodanese-related sulfurtransferase
MRPDPPHEVAFAGYGDTQSDAAEAVWHTFAEAFSRVFGWGQSPPAAHRAQARSSLERPPQRSPSMKVPRQIEDGLYAVDATWGSIHPMELAPGVRTVGELEVIDHIASGGPLIDTRSIGFYDGGTIPGARWIARNDIVDRLSEIDPNRETIFFCNGPQCAASPSSIRALLDAGFPSSSLLYYRGGIHDWVTLGLPLVAGEVTSGARVVAGRVEKTA